MGCHFPRHNLGPNFKLSASQLPRPQPITGLASHLVAIPLDGLACSLHKSLLLLASTYSSLSFSYCTDSPSNMALTVPSVFLCVSKIPILTRQGAPPLCDLGSWALTILSWSMVVQIVTQTWWSLTSLNYRQPPKFTSECLTTILQQDPHSSRQ